MIDYIKKYYQGDYGKYRTDVLESQNPRMRILDDVQVVIDSVTLKDIKENILGYMFSPLGTFTYYNALPLYISSGFLDQRRIIIDDLKLEDDSEIWEDIAKRMMNRVEALNASEMPKELRDKLTKNQKASLEFYEKLERGESVRIGSGALPPEELHKWIDAKRGFTGDQVKMGMVNSPNSPLLNAFHDLVSKPNKAQYKNPDQVSIWDDEIAITSWDDSKTGSRDAREIAIKKNSYNHSEMTIKFALEDFHTLLKGNEQASKFLMFYAETFREEIDIKEFADRLGVRPDNAKRYIKAGRDVLSSVKIEGSQGGYIYIFPTFIVGEEDFPSLGGKKGKKGKITIKTNEMVDFTLGANTTKWIPEHAYKFSKHGWLLTVKVYTQFRMKATDVNPEKDSHVISFPLLDIISALNLPHPDSTERIEQMIIEPLQKAIDEFNRGELDHGGAMKLSLALDYDKSPSVRVKNGHLVAELKKGDFYDLLAEIATKRAKHIQDKKERDRKKAEHDRDVVSRAYGRKKAELEHEDKKKSDS